MSKRLLALLVIFSLAWATGSLPPDRVFDTRINVEVRAGITLGDAIRVIARSAGVSVVVAQTPEAERRVTLDVKGKPFRQVWEGLFMGAAAELDYRVLPSRLIVVAPRNQIEAFVRARTPAPPPPPLPVTPPTPPLPPPIQPVVTPPSPPPPRVVQIYPADQPALLVNLLTSLLPDARIHALESPRALVVQATEQDHQVIQGLLAGLRTKTEEERARKPAPPIPDAVAFPPAPPAAPEPEKGREAVLFPVPDGGQALAQALTLRFPAAQVTFLEPLRVVMVQVEARDVRPVQRFVQQVIAARPPPAEKSQDTGTPVEHSRPLGYAKAAQVITLVGKLLPESREVTLAADERTNTVLMRGPRAAIAAIERLIKTLDRPVPQVDLQVRVEQINTSEGAEVGAALEAALGPFQITADPGQGRYGLGVEIGRTGLLTLNATLRALQSAGKGRSIINSRFTVSSGEKVNLHSGGTLLIPLAAPGEQNAAPGGVQNVEFGLELELTPTVIPGDKIQLEVRINLGDTPTPGPNRSTIIPKQELTSQVLLTSGNTAVLGGVVSVNVDETRSGIPLLKDIPLLGALFGQTSRTFRENHLLIVVTAISRHPEPVTTQPALPAVEPSAPAQPQAQPSLPVPRNFERGINVGGGR
jgi:hypothetical protein